MLAQVTRDRIFFSDLQNIFLDFAAILGFVNLFGIYKKKILKDSTFLLRFVIVFQI